MGPPQPPASEQSGSPAPAYNIPPPLLPAPKAENGTFNGYPTPSTSNMPQNGGGGGHYFEPTELFSPAPSANGTPVTGVPPTNGSSGSVPTVMGQVAPSPGAAGGNGFVVMAKQGSGVQQQQPGMNGGYQGQGAGLQQQQQQQQQGPGQGQQYMYGEPIYVQPMGRQPSGHGYPAETPAQHAVYK